MGINLDKIKKSYGTNLQTESDGHWFPLALIEGVEVKVARAGNPEYKKVLKRLYKPYTKQLRRGKDVASEVEDRIQLDLLIDTLLKDWKGMPGDDGQDVPFSKDAAKELLSDPVFKELKDEIIGFSEEFEAYQDEMDEELEKNLETT